MTKFSKEQLLEALGYSESPNYCLTDGQHHVLTAHLFRSAKAAGAEGAYLFRTSPASNEILPPRPAVYIAEATTPEQARDIHRSLWNLGNAPFLIVILPQQVRVYTCFEYDRKNKNKGLINSIDDLNSVNLKEVLSDYNADSIDSGRLWASQSRHLKPEGRLDTHLLKNLRKLEEVLVENNLDRQTAHALIGKYVYIRYLWDRGILSEPWLEENGVDIDLVLGGKAKLKGLRKLVEKLDDRFNGHIFPLPLSGKKAPTDEQIAIAATAFKGTDPASGQMPLFDLYDFSYIPVETLSSIYEQFLHSQGKGKKVGAIYTPEHLADYLLAELNSAKPLKRGMKVLDPCCGSGIFLVLAYRKLIELELQARKVETLRPTELRTILTESVFGVERDKEACHVAELSLILTMLHYILPPDLHRNKLFQFPVLHNQQIFEADFFDDSSEFWRRGERFDWIIGNPPWIEPEKSDKEEHYVISWIYELENRQKRPVAGNRVAEAFSWRVTDLLGDDGCVGLVLNATSLFNHESKKYRQAFFKQYETLRITNFSNLRYVMFYGRGKVPAATIIYRDALLNQEKANVIHYGPFAINQSLSESWKHSGRKEAWALTINESEINSVTAKDSETGDAAIWKLAFWGCFRDKRALQRLQHLFSSTLDELSLTKGWHIHEGVSLREQPIYNEEVKYEIEAMPELKGQYLFDSTTMAKSRRRFSAPESAFQRIPANRCFVRKRSGLSSLKESTGAYLVLNAAYFVFTDQDFILINPNKRISAPPHHADELRALSVFLNSSVAQYSLFFLSSAWGIGRSLVYSGELRELPVPAFSPEQVVELAKLQKMLSAEESKAEDFNDMLQERLQEIADNGVERILSVPEKIGILAKDFMKIRLSMNEGKIDGAASRMPEKHDLLNYGVMLRNELDDFTKGRTRHKVSFINSPDFEITICEVEITNASQPLEVSFANANGHLKASLSHLNQTLKQRFSQWVYVQRGLRIFDGSKVYICKAPRLIDWTKTQALNDSDDLIAEVLSGNYGQREVAVNGAKC